MQLKILLCLFFLFLVVPPSASAHVNGQSIFTINGELTKIYTPENNFNTAAIPEDSDSAPAIYAVSEPLEFVLDTTKFPTNQDIFAKTDFLWDFGDGTPVQTIRYGTTNSHTYQEPGTYILTVTADYSSAGFTIPPQVLETVFITVGEKKAMQTSPFRYGIGVLFLLLFGSGILFIRKHKTKRLKPKKQ